MPIIEFESSTSIKELVADSCSGEKNVYLNLRFQRFALNISLTLNNGVRINCKIDDELLKRIFMLKEWSLISGTLATIGKIIFRFFDHSKVQTLKRASIGKRRDKYMTLLLDKLKHQISKDEDKPCITRNVLKNLVEKLDDGRPFLSQEKCRVDKLLAEVKSIGLTMVSAGLDTIPANLTMGIGYLSSLHGQEIEERAYAEIEKAFPDGDAWESV